MAYFEDMTVSPLYKHNTDYRSVDPTLQASIAARNVATTGTTHVKTWGWITMHCWGLNKDSV